jgi:hypothetical protein
MIFLFNVVADPKNNRVISSGKGQADRVTVKPA